MNTDSNPIAENSVLSLMMRDDRVRRRVLGEGIDADHFGPGRHLFAAICGLSRVGAVIDGATVTSELQRTGYLEESGGADAVAALYHYAAGADHMTEWLRILRDCKALRIGRDASSWLAECRDSGEAENAIKTALAAIQEAKAGPTMSMSAYDCMKEFEAHIEELFNSGDMPGISTGIDMLDVLSGGMRPGELWNILGQTSRGKSVLMLQMAAHAANLGKKTAIFSAEMMRTNVFGRFVANVGSLSMGAITQPRTANQYQRQRMAVTMKRLSEMSFWINQTPGMSIEYIEAEATRLADANDGLDLVVVDYLQFLKTKRERGENKEQEISRISSALKQLAKALGCPVLTGAQLNRQNEARESARIEMDADCLLVICDDGVKVAKLRNGKKDETLPIFLNGELQRFERN